MIDWDADDYDDDDERVELFNLCGGCCRRLRWPFKSLNKIFIKCDLKRSL